MDQSPSARERQARLLATLALPRPPGAAWEYSNLNYLLLGLIIEAVSGGSYESYIQDHIFGPLQMHHSYTARTDAERDGLAVGHRYWFGVPVAAPELTIPRGPIPGGYLISSPQDMAQYLIAHLNGGRYRGAQILSPEGVDELHRAAATVEIMGMPAGASAMGWIAEDIGRTRILWHDGIVPDFYSYMALVPESKRGIVLLVNANHLLMTSPLREVGTGLGSLLAGHPPKPIRLGAIPWLLRGLPLIPLVEAIGLATSVRQVRRRRCDPISRPLHEGTWVGYLLRALSPNLLAAMLLLIVRRRGLLRVLLLFMPDVSWTALICGSIALLSTFVRTGLIFWSARKPRVSR
jgi:CubicO group peptidase (beta-lactamase class C family)